MGCLQNSAVSDPEEDHMDRALQKELAKEKKIATQIRKVLFLGPGGCGKSTLFKQLRNIYGSPFTEKERLHSRDAIYSFVMETMKGLVQAIDYSELSPNVQEAAAFVEGQDIQIYITPKIAAFIQTLWAEKTVKDSFDKRVSTFHPLCIVLLYVGLSSIYCTSTLPFLHSRD